MSDSSNASSSRLAASSYNSPYSRAGAPSPHPNTDPYAKLRAQALTTLEAMGYDPKTMVEHGVVWAEDQDPFGHVMHSQYMHFIGSCLYRLMESYDQFLSTAECDDMLQGKSVISAVRKYELSIRRQVQYPDSLIAAYRQSYIEPSRNNGTLCLFSLKQQTIVAEVKGSTTFMDLKTGRPVNIRTLGGGWPAVYDHWIKTAEQTKVAMEKWERDHPKVGPIHSSKI
ncbi:Uu.00g145310.m01.CDS01 [Anthostomella pinea]|uniref:Uu.00g145310.m01.CDS01 n=1 Tax=Anthostomella pinea TaxID=933095 RepID=A0AAI8VKJ0_9PEZI|nr:Uu.00g145310.m01.CDS01 [Anthostomella pinea]